MQRSRRPERNVGQPLAIPKRKPGEEHPSVVALMAEAHPGESAADVIRRKCRAMVQRAKTFGWSGPPFDPRILASLHDIVVEKTAVDFGSEGRIFPRRGKVVIQLRAGAMIERERFTICHELAHTCFPDAFDFVRHQDASPGDEACRKFENLCDIGAAELLLPYDEFHADLQKAHPVLSHTSELSQRYVASIDATMKRMLDLTDHPCAAAFLTDEEFKEFQAVAGRMRVKYFWKSTNFRGFLPPGNLLPKSSCAHSAPPTASKLFPTARETWWINSRPYSWYVESLRLPTIPNNSEYPKVVTLLHSRQPTNNGG
jgi:hypothetical protein